MSEWISDSGTLLAWKIASAVSDFFDKFGISNNAIRMTAGIILSITGFALEFTGLKNILSGNGTMLDYVKAAVGSALYRHGGRSFALWFLHFLLASFAVAAQALMGTHSTGMSEPDLKFLSRILCNESTP